MGYMRQAKNPLYLHSVEHYLILILGLHFTGFRAVSFTLRTRDLPSTVLDILNACSLSTNHVQNLSDNADTRSNKGTQRTFHRPIKWDKTYYSFTGFKDPEEELEQAQRMETTLRYLHMTLPSISRALGLSFPLLTRNDSHLFQEEIFLSLTPSYLFSCLEMS